MAAAVVSSPSPIAYCGRLEQFGRAELLRIGTDGSGLAPTAAETTLGITAGSIAEQALSLALDGYVEFTLTMAADTNTAGVLNLTDTLGVDFLTTSSTRRLEYECYIKADVDCGMIVGKAVVACAATPIVGELPVSTTVDVDEGAPTSNVTFFQRAVLPGDLATATAALSQSSNDVILTLTGVTDIDTRWYVKVRVFPRFAHTLIATT